MNAALPVSMEDEVPNPVREFTGVNVNGGDNTTQTYIPGSGQVVDIRRIDVSSKGPMEVVVRYGPTGGNQDMKFVANTTAAGLTHSFIFNPPERLTDTDTLLVVLYNVDTNAHPVYSTIQGQIVS